VNEDEFELRLFFVQSVVFLLRCVCVVGVLVSLLDAPNDAVAALLFAAFFVVGFIGFGELARSMRAFDSEEREKRARESMHREA